MWKQRPGFEKSGFFWDFVYFSLQNLYMASSKLRELGMTLSLYFFLEKWFLREVFIDKNPLS